MDMAGYSWHVPERGMRWLINHEGKIVGNTQKRDGYTEATHVQEGKKVTEPFLTEEQAKAWLLKTAKLLSL